MSELEINENNFNEYFRDVRKSKFEKDDVLAKYTAVAEFVDGGEKRQIISLLLDTENKMEATIQVMRKLLFASEKDAIRIPREMATDLLGGMSVDDCAKKPYKYTVEMFYYTKKEYIPENDPHWCSISMITPEEIEGMKSKVLSEEENEKLNQEMRK